MIMRRIWRKIAGGEYEEPRDFIALANFGVGGELMEKHLKVRHEEKG